MKLHHFALLPLFFIACSAHAAFFDNDCPEPAINGSGASFETAFTPDTPLSDMVIKSITSAKTSIKVAAHRFVSKDVSVALLNASRAGKEVDILLDKAKNEDGYSDAIFFINMSHPPHSLKGLDNQYQDYMVIDGKDIVIGNISSLAQVDDEKKNAAGVLVIHNVPDLAKKYSDNFQKLWESSEVMVNKNLTSVKPEQKKP